jgi:hypothetical protein
MDQAGFKPSDELRRRVAEAFDAVHRLSVELHCLARRAGKRAKK